MAQKPDGKAAKTERVVFTRPAAERISKAVRIVESGDRNATGLRFGTRSSGSSGAVIKFAYYTATTNWTVVAYGGATTTNNTKVIQFATPTSTPFATALCVNHMASMPRLTTVATNATMLVLSFKDGEFYKLIGARS